MGATFEKARPEVHQMAREIMEAHHKDLQLGPGEYPTLCILLASMPANEQGHREPALTAAGGRPEAAQVRVIPYKQRVDDRRDAEILIDEQHWNDATEPQQRALLDRCITYLEILKDENGFVKTDDHGRPKLKVRLADWHLEGFRSIAERYGSDALEVQAARKFEEQFGEVTIGKGSLFAH